MFCLRSRHSVCLCRVIQQWVSDILWKDRSLILLFCQLSTEATEFHLSVSRYSTDTALSYPVVPSLPRPALGARFWEVCSLLMASWPSVLKHFIPSLQSCRIFWLLYTIVCGVHSYMITVALQLSVIRLIILIHFIRLYSVLYSITHTIKLIL